MALIGPLGGEPVAGEQPGKAEVKISAPAEPPIT
jgi:hypothetical protein